MNVYIILIIVGIVIQICGVIGFMTETKLEVTITNNKITSQIVDNDTGHVLSQAEGIDDVMRKYKLIKR